MCRGIRKILFLLFLFITGIPIEAASPRPENDQNLFDGIIVPKDSIKKIQAEENIKKAQAFYDSLEVKASRNRWIKELHDILINGNELQENGHSYKKSKSIEPYLDYQNKYIRRIKINKIDVFGPEVYDTTIKPNTWIEEYANKLHFKTIDNIIRNNILVKRGEKVDPWRLADNERLLRELPYIHDARITVDQLEGDSVDLTYIIKDVWSKGFGLQFGGLNSGRFDFWDRNIFGTGHENENSILWNDKKNPKLGYEGYYRIKNISGTFINTTLKYVSAFDEEIYELDISRKFFTPSTKYAVGLLINKSSTIEGFEYYDTLSPTEIKYNHTNFWLGRSFPLKSRNLLESSRQNLTISSAVYHYHFTETPFSNENIFQNFQSRTLYLGSISYNKQGFYKTNYLYSFGRTEDIPYGMILTIIAGPEFNQFNNRFYTGLSLSRGTYLIKLGYLYYGFDLGFFNAQNMKIDQGTLHLRSRYFTKLIKIGDYRFRQFAKFTYSMGYNRNKDEFITINNSLGIRGFRSKELKDEKKMVLNLESVFFSPLYVYGFRFVFYGFADLALMGSKKDFLLNQRLYSGFGLGMRIRNEKLVFRTIQLQLAIYPGAPADVKNYLFEISGEPRLHPENFEVKSPKIIEYK